MNTSRYYLQNAAEFIGYAILMAILTALMIWMLLRTDQKGDTESTWIIITGTCVMIFSGVQGVKSFLRFMRTPDTPSSTNRPQRRAPVSSNEKRPYRTWANRLSDEPAGSRGNNSNAANADIKAIIGARFEAEERAQRESLEAERRERRNRPRMHKSK